MEAAPCIKVQVHTKYIPDQSHPDAKRYVFAYIITIKNLSQQEVQLMSRRWLITDSNGKQMTVEGEGVVGQQPVIAANDDEILEIPNSGVTFDKEYLSGMIKHKELFVLLFDIDKVFALNN